MCRAPTLPAPTCLAPTWHGPTCSAPISGKRSTPWEAQAVHDFMHAKLTVADDVIFTGSFNLSRSGESNAENVLELEDPELAERLAGYVDEVRARYPPFTVDPR